MVDQCRQVQKDTVGPAMAGEHGDRNRKDGLRENPSNAHPALASQGVDKNLAHQTRQSRAQKTSATKNNTTGITTIAKAV